MLHVDPNTGAVLSIVRKDGAQGAGEDTNGNQISGGTDTLGRAFSATSYYDSNGVLRNITTTRQSIAIQTHLCWASSADFCNEYSATWNMPQVITLPNGMSYTFTYDQGSPTHVYYGQPLSVIVPMGGQITWGWSGEDETGPTLVTRQLSGVPGPWKYASGPTTVTDPAVNGTVFTGLPINNKLYYQGSSVSGTLIKTVQIDFSTQDSITHTPPVLPIHETTT